MPALSILMLTFIFYTPVLKNGFTWDDNYYVTNNLTIRDFDGLQKIWLEIGAVPQYYPLVHTSFWVEYHLWQLHPFGYHMVNVLLHALNAILLWLILQQLRIPGAWLAAAIFALHPVHVESVAWITERKNVLSGFFYLSAIITYLRFLRPGVNPSPPTRQYPASSILKYHWRYYALALGLYICALLSKTVTCTMPAAILLLLLWKQDRITRRNVLLLIPYFILGAALGLLTVWMERNIVGAQGEAWMLSFPERFLLAGRVLWFYAGKLFWPHKLTFIYPHWQIDSGIWWQYLFPAAAAAVIIGLWLFRRQTGKGPIVAVLFFLCTLAPALGFFDVYPMRFSYVADHFQYLASIGLIALSVATLTTIVRRLGPLYIYTGFAASVVILPALGILVWQQGHIYKNVETLWRDTIAKNPDAWIAHNNLGLVYADKGLLDEAVSEYNRAIVINPNYADAHNNLGNANISKGMVEKAVSEYKKALAINPDYASAYNNLGLVYANKGMSVEAITEYKKALAVSPGYADAHYNLGNAFLKKGMLDESISEYKQAIAINPGYSKAHNNLGLVYANKGMSVEAVSEYKKALAINPGYPKAHNNLALIYHSKGNYKLAIVHCDKAVSLRYRVSPKLLELLKPYRKTRNLQ